MFDDEVSTYTFYNREVEYRYLGFCVQVELRRKYHADETDTYAAYVRSNGYFMAVPGIHYSRKEAVDVSVDLIDERLGRL